MTSSPMKRTGFAPIRIISDACSIVRISNVFCRRLPFCRTCFQIIKHLPLLYIVVTLIATRFSKVEQKAMGVFTDVSLPSVGGVVFILFFVLEVFRIARQYFRLRHFKGPRSTGISKFWQLKSVIGPRTHLDLSEVCDKYG